MQSKDANRISKLLAKKQNLQENQIKILNGFHITEKSLTNSLHESILAATHACMTENFTYTNPHTKGKGKKGISHQFKSRHQLFTKVDNWQHTNSIFNICNKTLDLYEKR